LEEEGEKSNAVVRQLFLTGKRERFILRQKEIALQLG